MWFSEFVQHPLAIAGVRFNFMPSWWYRNYGVEYGERMVFDPDYRVQMYMAMRRLMHERFGEIGLGSPDPEPAVIAPDWQNTMTPAAVGCAVEYPRDNYPISHHLDPEQIARLRVPEDVAAVFPYSEFDRQIRYLNGKLGQDAPPRFGLRGVLNDACLIRGVDALGDLYAEPEASAHLLGLICGLSLALARHDHTAQAGGGYMLCNCTEVMVSTATYERLLMPYDRRIYGQVASLGEAFALHHCGPIDAYLPLYRRLGAISWLEIGSDSDIRLALETFPEAQMSYIVSTRFVAVATRAQVGEKVDQVLEAARGHWSRLSLNVADLEYGTPDENIAEVYERCRLKADRQS